MTRSTFRTIGFTLALAGAASPAFAWGEKGHSAINSAAAGLMESPAAALFQANLPALALLATTPDIQWKKSPTYAQEAPMHFFQWDNYSTSALGQTIDKVIYSQLLNSLGATYVKTNGSSVWRVDQLYVMLVNALKTGDWVTALQMGGTLGHYVGDLSQPMHDTSDYDGQSIGRSGIHMYFETTLVNALNQTTLTDDIVNAGGPLRQQLDTQYANTTESGDQLIRTIVVSEATTAYGQLAPVLSQFNGSSQNDDGLRAFFGPRMGAGAATLAKIWDLAAADAGVTSTPSQQLQVAEPAWFALQDPTATQQ